MCGINAILNAKQISSLESDILKMNELIKHRGPDDQGAYVKGKHALGHTRLSILDLSKNGHQPMSKDDGITMVFNGEIFNYIELREELLKLGHSFSTKTDSEVILAAFQEWGEECVTHFNGMWSFVILDEVKNRVFASRDRFGVKPFYFWRSNETWYISSEIKPILNNGCPVKADLTSVLNFLVLDICDESERTFFSEVKRLKPGHYISIDLSSNDFEIKPYYSLSRKYHDGLSPGKVALGDLMKDAVRLRLRSDVRVGTCLSGGLDSSFIAGTASQIYEESNNDKFLAFTAKSADPNNDESDFAKEVVDYCNLDWVVSKTDVTSFKSVIDSVLLAQEEPFRSPSIFLQYNIMKEAKLANCKVLLDGQGGDEVFLGYERYYAPLIRSVSLRNKLKSFRAMVANSKLSWFKGFKLLVYMSSSKIRKRRLVLRAGFLNPDALRKVSWQYLKDLSEANIRKVQVNEIERFNLPALLRYEDKNSMQFSIETRLPFLDFRVIENGIALEPTDKIKDGWTKFPIRKMCADLVPESIAWRKNKIGFEAPTSIWLSDVDFFVNEINNSSILRSIAVSPIEAVKDQGMLWRLYNIARWEKLFSVQL